MKINRQKVLVWGLILASIYVVYRYWGVAEEILMTVFDASKPFFVGAMISYIVNILMDGYENLITRFVSFQPVLKMKRNLSLLLSLFDLCNRYYRHFGDCHSGVNSSCSIITFN